MTLDDSILGRIEWSDDPALRSARAIIERIRKRGDSLYRYVNEVTVPLEHCWDYREVKPEDVAGKGPGLRAEDVIVHNLKARAVEPRPRARES